MALTDLLSRPVAYHRVFRAITGNTVAAIMLSQALYWQHIVDRGKGGKNGWWYKSGADWNEELGLNRSEQETARKILITGGLLKTEKRGVPARMWYHLDLNFLEKKLQEYQQNAGVPQTRNYSKQVCRDPAGKFAGNRQTISKNTSKTTTTPLPPPGEQQVVGVGQIKEYVRLAEINGQVKSPVGLERHLISKGLTPLHLQQLQDWKKAEEDKQRQIDGIALQAEKQKIEQEKDREKVEAAWNYFLALPEKDKERLTSDYLSSLPIAQRRDYDPKKDKWRACLKYWLPEKIGGEVAQC